MRLIVLKLSVSIAALVFLVMLAAIARHRMYGLSQTNRVPALAEYLWATIPWLMIIACAIPAARQVVASAHARSHDAAPVATVLDPASRTFHSNPAVVIDQQEREQR